MIIDENENRYAIIGINDDDTEHLLSRWGMESTNFEIINYYKPLAILYKKIQIWVVNYKDEKLYELPDVEFNEKGVFGLEQ